MEKMVKYVLTLEHWVTEHHFEVIFLYYDQTWEMVCEYKAKKKIHSGSLKVQTRNQALRKIKNNDKIEIIFIAE